MGIIVSLFFFLFLAAGLAQQPHAKVQRQLGAIDQIYQDNGELVAFDNDDKYLKQIAGGSPVPYTAQFSNHLHIQLASSRWLNKPPLFVLLRTLLI